MYYFIYSLASGKKNRAAALKNQLASFDIVGDFAIAKTPEEIFELTKKAKTGGFATLVIIGGDGAINCTIQEIVGTEIVLGVIPIGQNNIFSKTLGITSIGTAINALLPRKVELIDVGKCNNFYFASYLKIGREVKRQKLFGTTKKSEAFQANLELDEGKLNLRGEFSDITISKVTLPYRENIPEELSDGLLKILLKSNIKTPTILKASKIALKTIPELSLYFDGEERGFTPAEIEVQTKSLRVIVPKESE